MKRRLCSCDMFAVPEPCYVLRDDVGDMCFCNLRCFAIWAVQRATKAGLSDEERIGVFRLNTPVGEEQLFAGINDVARWVISRALVEHGASLNT